MISTESAVAQPAAGTADSSVRLVQTWIKPSQGATKWIIKSNF